MEKGVAEQAGVVPLYHITKYFNYSLNAGCNLIMVG